MANLSPLSFQQAVQNTVSAYDAGAQRPANTGPNSSLGPIFNAVSLLSSALQGQIQYVNGVARLGTSTGPDIDSFVNVFGVLREGGAAATGTVAFLTNSPAGSNLLVGNGTIVQTPDGTQFEVVADPSQSGYSATLGGYVILSGSSTVNATVAALVAGSSGNVLAQTITQIVSSQANPAPAGVANVSNAAAFTNGSDQETDAALILRFSQIMANRWATDGAVASAVESTQSGLTYTVGDMLDQSGNLKPNFFTVFVNVLGQSSGPSSAVLSDVTAQVDANRPIGIPYQVIAPTLLSVSGSVTLQLAPGANSANVIAAAQTAFASYINNLGLGDNIVTSSNVSGATTTCSYNQIIVLLRAVAGVVAIPDPPGLILNGATVDITAAWGVQLVAGALTVTTS